MVDAFEHGAVTARPERWGVSRAVGGSSSTTGVGAALLYYRTYPTKEHPQVALAERGGGPCTCAVPSQPRRSAIAFACGARIAVSAVSMPIARSRNEFPPYERSLPRTGREGQDPAPTHRSTAAGDSDRSLHIQTRPQPRRLATLPRPSPGSSRHWKSRDGNPDGVDANHVRGCAADQEPAAVGSCRYCGMHGNLSPRNGRIVRSVGRQGCSCAHSHDLQRC